jgi:FixJ family two-component response regulator
MKAFAAMTGEASRMTESGRRPAAGEVVPTVFVVEDDISVRESVGLLIRAGGWRPALFSTAREFLEHPVVDTPRCLVLDMTLPDLNGLDLQQRLSEGERMPIIFITGAVNVSMTVQAMKAGAFEFLSKPFDHQALSSAIEQAIQCSSAAIERLARLRALEQAHALLTSRERQVMQLVVAGRMNKQIASELGISELTVKAHRGRVMRKMGAESVAALVKIDAQLHL